MIRIYVEGGLQAMFEESEPITVCEDVIDGEYILNEAWYTAGELLAKWSCGENEQCRFIFLNADQFRDAIRHGTTRSSDAIYKIVRVTP
jgi:hypothetical protein